ncbi:hypothetical protein BC834DRAFT_847309 [Gloeopeniophorella convolvens]|nr:hypothetical protein BC834DRAFT_847309 [Gloeopeniophorella convolvens]
MLSGPHRVTLSGRPMPTASNPFHDSLINQDSAQQPNSTPPLPHQHSSVDPTFGTACFSIKSLLHNMQTLHLCLRLLLRGVFLQAHPECMGLLRKAQSPPHWHHGLLPGVKDTALVWESWARAFLKALEFFEDDMGHAHQDAEIISAEQRAVAMLGPLADVGWVPWGRCLLVLEVECPIAPPIEVLRAQQRWQYELAEERESVHWMVREDAESPTELPKKLVRFASPLSSSITIPSFHHIPTPFPANLAGPSDDHPSRAEIHRQQDCVHAASEHFQDAHMGMQDAPNLPSAK